MTDDKPNGKLNGLKVPLLVNGATLAAVAIPLIALYADVQQLKTQRSEEISVERFTRLETLVQAGTDQRYRAGDAVRDFQLRDAEIQRLREDIKVLQDRMDRGHR